MSSRQKIELSFRGKLWRHRSKGGWYFVTLPKGLSKRIRKSLQSSESGWGRLAAVINIGESQWQTSIWFDTKADAYLLPVKADVRKKEDLHMDQTVSGHITVEMDEMAF